ncbi:hypothetical protein M8C21_010481 [Ambrosia artemisiifolia]|uniref:Uncharacterized protein n=1 Tax=Ambrosia artemisiifolia TaxID=4212 RepID=A0AAD5GJT3_AMBAR|nr:hypothetical protein M8C21_010481 [Ambrosia artemisiifolia]
MSMMWTIAIIQTKILLLYSQRRLDLKLQGFFMANTQLLLHMEPEEVERHIQSRVLKII